MRRWPSHGGARFLDCEGRITGPAGENLQLVCPTPIRRAAWSWPVGRLVAVTNTIGTVIVYETRTGRQVTQSHRFSGARVLGWSAHGRRLAMGDAWGCIHLWCPERGWRGLSNRPTSCTASLAWGAQHMLAAGYLCGRVCVWRDDELLDTWSTEGPVSSLAWNAESTRLALCELAGSRIQVISQTGGRMNNQPDATLMLHDKEAYAESIVWSPTRLLAATAAGEAVWWRIPRRGDPYRVAPRIMRPDGVVRIDDDTLAGAWWMPSWVQSADSGAHWTHNEERALAIKFVGQDTRCFFLPLSESTTERRRLLARGLWFHRASKTCPCTALARMASFFEAFPGMRKPLLKSLLLYTR